MLYNNRITGTLVLALIIGLTLAVTPTTGSHAQTQTTQTQSAPSRPRRAGDAPSQSTTSPTPSSSEQTAPRSAPAPQPTPKDDDVTVQDDEVVRVETDLTNILFTAADKQKRFVTTLKQEDIRILEDGKPQEIFTFSRQTDLPLSLAILVDTSASEQRTLPQEKDAASAFITSVIRPDRDEAAVVSFTGEATLELGLTSNVSRVRRALDKVEFVPPSGYIGNGTIVGTPPISGTNQSLAGSTAIWDSIWITSDEVLSQTSDKTRRAIILLTDGVDTSSQKKMSEAIDRAVRADAVIYAIGIGDRYVSGIDEGSLRKVSERTGGRAFFPDDESELRTAFAQIQQELRSQYLIAYSPINKARDGSFRRVEIEFANPELKKQNLKLTYRQGYFAKSNPSTLIPPPSSKRRP